jgi:hypothetical protein
LVVINARIACWNEAGSTATLDVVVRADHADQDDEHAGAAAAELRRDGTSPPPASRSTPRSTPPTRSAERVAHAAGDDHTQCSYSSAKPEPTERPSIGGFATHIHKLYDSPRRPSATDLALTDLGDLFFMHEANAAGFGEEDHLATP